jgi:hypothetical protein
LVAPGAAVGFHFAEPLDSQGKRLQLPNSTVKAAREDEGDYVWTSSQAVFANDRDDLVYAVSLAPNDETTGNIKSWTRDCKSFREVID